MRIAAPWPRPYFNFQELKRSLLCNHQSPAYDRHSFSVGKRSTRKNTPIGQWLTSALSNTIGKESAPLHPIMWFPTSKDQAGTSLLARLDLSASFPSSQHKVPSYCVPTSARRAEVSKVQATALQPSSMSSGARGKLSTTLWYQWIMIYSTQYTGISGHWRPVTPYGKLPDAGYPVSRLCCPYPAPAAFNASPAFGPHQPYALSLHLAACVSQSLLRHLSTLALGSLGHETLVPCAC